MSWKTTMTRFVFFSDFIMIFKILKSVGISVRPMYIQHEVFAVFARLITLMALITRRRTGRAVIRGVDPYGTGGTRPPNIWTGGT